MKCQQCGKENELGEKFCVHCGNNVELTETQAQTAAAQESFAVPSTHPSFGQPTAPSEHFVITKAKGYISYIRQHLRVPTVRSQYVDQTEKINGIITLVLFAFILPLLLYIPLARSGFTQWIDHAFTTLFLKPLFIVIVLLAILAGVLYGMTQLMKVKVHILDVIARLGSYMVIPTALLLLSLIFSIISADKLMMFTLYFGLLSAGTSISFLIHSYRQAQSDGLDPFYGVILTYLALGIVLYLFGDSLFGVFNY